MYSCSKKKKNKLVKIFRTNLLALLNMFNSVADVHFFSIWCPTVSLKYSSSCQTPNVPIWRLVLSHSWASLVAQFKESACQSRRGFVPESARSPGEGNGNPLQYSCLENPMEREACGLQSMRPQEVRHDWATNTSALPHGAVRDDVVT